jgi:hypothetical protein
MPSHTTHGGGYGALSAQILGDLMPDVVLTQAFTATGASSSVPVPSGVGVASLQTFVFGALTAVTVVVQGSVDGSTWFTIPAVESASRQRWTFVRLNCTALTGGTTPTVVAVAVCSP